MARHTACGFSDAIILAPSCLLLRPRFYCSRNLLVTILRLLLDRASVLEEFCSIPYLSRPHVSGYPAFLRWAGSWDERGPRRFLRVQIGGLQGCLYLAVRWMNPGMRPSRKHTPCNAACNSRYVFECVSDMLGCGTNCRKWGKMERAAGPPGRSAPVAPVLADATPPIEPVLPDS
eukprot:2254744-Amphidinium_carterae.1